VRTIERTTQFKRDVRRESRGRHATAIERDLAALIMALADDRPLAARHRDHALTGDWSDHRDCHVRPDLVLIDRKPDATTLQRVRLGSHSEIGL